MQAVNRVIEGCFLFDAGSALLKQRPRPQYKRFLSLHDAVCKFGLINLRECGLVQIHPRSARLICGAVFIHDPEDLLNHHACCSAG
jgi:hypothetical protein